MILQRKAGYDAPPRDVQIEASAKALNPHAEAEYGHHLMMSADVHLFENHWSSRNSRSINADTLLTQASSDGARSYCEVHVRNITGDTPLAHVANEYEIEQLPLRYGTFFLGPLL